ncbi:hypothetical protein NE237_008363 [Protea cynaroides]|uniref:Alpha 1,4-glycosyltransferase domain-containing protein n=1 Tax=Protea cynaroides TaxID=273540 RepID=A0A9Q0KVI9_9MAGN|nr:hypothetical protein NE237_008363 [Protea cynaroides]
MIINVRSLGKAKFSFFSITIATIFFLILFTGCIFSNIFLQNAASGRKEETQFSLTHISRRQFRSASLSSVKEEEISKGHKDPGEIPLAQNLSNLLRLAVLYKYGGVYLDTDFIVLKKFSGLRNSIAAQSMDAETGNWTRLNNAVLIFDKNHPLLFKFIEEFSLTFDGNKWGHNGPYLVSRVVKRVRKRPGYYFRILSSMAFYPVDWNKISGFFQKPKDQAMSRWISTKLFELNTKTYGVHLWNKQSSQLKIEEASIIDRLISDHCVLCEDIYSS